MTDQEIADKVESWNWNANIFEIYDEVKHMANYASSQRKDLSRLLTHAYDYFNHDPMIKELADFLGAEITEEKELTLTS